MPMAVSDRGFWVRFRGGGGCVGVSSFGEGVGFEFWVCFFCFFFWGGGGVGVSGFGEGVGLRVRGKV